MAHEKKTEKEKEMTFSHIKFIKYARNVKMSCKQCKLMKADYISEKIRFEVLLKLFIMANFLSYERIKKLL